MKNKTKTKNKTKYKLITQSDIKKRYGLTLGLIKKIGEPNELRKNPIKGASPIKLYSVSRVLHWMHQNQNLIEKSKKRQKSARKAVRTKFFKGRSMLRRLLTEFVLIPVDLDQAKLEAKEYFEKRYDNFDGEVTEKGLVSYLRHKYTNYEEILTRIQGKIGAGILYTDTKVYLCVRIVDFYKLTIDPLIAAFGHPKDIPERYQSKEPIGDLIRRLLGINKE